MLFLTLFRSRRQCVDATFDFFSHKGDNALDRQAKDLSKATLSRATRANSTLFNFKPAVAKRGHHLGFVETTKRSAITYVCFANKRRPKVHQVIIMQPRARKLLRSKISRSMTSVFDPRARHANFVWILARGRVRFRAKENKRLKHQNYFIVKLKRAVKQPASFGRDRTATCDINITRMSIFTHTRNVCAICWRRLLNKRFTAVFPCEKLRGFDSPLL